MRNLIFLMALFVGSAQATGFICNDIPFSIIVASIVCGAIYIIVGTWLSKNEEKLKEKMIH